MYECVGTNDWPNSSVFDLAQWKNGLAFKNIDFSETGRPVIKIAELKNGITQQTARTMADYEPSVLVTPGDMLFSWSGNPDTSIDVFRWEGEEGWLNQHIFKVTPRAGISAEFLFFLLKWLKPRFAEIARNKQTTGLGHVTIQDLKRMQVAVPKVDEQAAIVEIIGPIQEKIELNRRMNETLEAMARAIFKDWFVDFGPTHAKMEGRPPHLSPDLWSLFPDRFDEKGKPEGWRQGRLGDFTELQNGYAFKSTEWQTAGTPVVKIGSVKPSVVDLKQVSFVSQKLARDRAAFQLKVGDVVVGLTGYVGETGRVPPTANTPLLNQRVGRFSSSGTFSPFVYACVRQPEFKQYAEGKAHGSAQPNVSTKDLLDYPVTAPPEMTLRSFEELVAPLFQRSLANFGEIAALSETRDFLLPKLMSGEVRVKDAEKIAGEAT
jgi:type I restriction enzyme S subunit